MVIARERAVDGVRAIAHLSLIALHSSMLVTSHLPSDGALWESLKTNWIFSTLQAGGIQVDVMFMLSAFLLTSQLLSGHVEKTLSIPMFALKRALRMLPCILALLLISGYWMGDCFLPYIHKPEDKAMLPRILSVIFFINNYFDQTLYGSFSGSLLWSCSVELQVGVAIFAIVMLLRRQKGLNDGTAQSSIALAKKLKWVSCGLILLAVVIRAVIFEPEIRNLVKLGQYSHFGLMMTDTAVHWIRETYSHTWHTSNDANVISQEYLNTLYMPTHSRFGPFGVGVFLACAVYLAKHPDVAHTSSPVTTSPSMLSRVVKWAITAAAFVQLLMPCAPPPPIDDIPVEAQHYVTAALRCLSASAAAFLLYRAVVPHTHGWHWPGAALVLSWTGWRHIADISFCSYLCHFRILMELILNPTWRSVFGLTVPAISSDTLSIDELTWTWILYILSNYMMAVTLSVMVSTIAHYCYELPMAKLVAHLLSSSNKTKSK